MAKREMPFVGKPTVGSHEECMICGRRFRVETLEDGAYDDSTGKAEFFVLLGNPGCHCFPDDSVYYPRCWDSWSPNEEEWFEALDEAIANVFRKECARLRTQRPQEFSTRLNDAFVSIRRLSGRKLPDYDEWDALLYVSWYQARQVHLVCAILKQYPPPPSRGPLRVVDVGCGAWAVPIALAMLAVRGHQWLRDRQVSIHAIDPSRSMTRIGRKLWREFGRTAQVRALDTGFIDRMTDDDSISTSTSYPDPLAGVDSAESWLLAIHAVYGRQHPRIRQFLHDYRRRASRLRYEILTTDGKKKDLLESIIVDRPGKWIRPQPIWSGELTSTNGVRIALHRHLEASLRPMTTKHMEYLREAVRWDPSRNPIRHDAVWVRSAVQ